MVLPVLNALGTTRLGANSRPLHKPVLNQVPLSSNNSSSRFGGYNNLANRFWTYYKTTSEFVAIANILKTDIIGDRPTFVSPDGKALGRNKRLEAERRWRNDRMKETCGAIVIDTVVTGDGYGFISKLSTAERMTAAKEIAKAIKFKYSMKEDLNSLAIKISQDEDMKKPRGFDYIAASTVSPETDNYDVLGYTQNSNGITTRFTTDEVIHFRWSTQDGKINGFTPTESLVKELALIWFVKGNMTAYMQNGGSPGKLFIMKNNDVGTPAYDRFVDQMRSFKDVNNRHGSFIGTGDIDVKDLDLNPKDLEYENLALYVTSCLAFAFGIPVTRIPFLIGKSATSGDSGGMAESGYWNMISEKQDMFEDLLNSQYFEKFGYNIRLNRKYKQDEVREAQVLSMKTSTFVQINTELAKKGKRLSMDYISQMLGIPLDSMEDMPKEEMQSQAEKTGLLNQNLLDNMSINKEPDNRKKADTKRNIANQKDNKTASV